MALSITLNIPCNSASLIEAAQLIEALRDVYPDDDLPDAMAGVPADPNLPPEPQLDAGRNAEDFIEAWLKHLGPASRKFWRIVARYASTPNVGGHLPLGITFEDLEIASRIRKASLRSYHRNSYRAINFENAPDPMPGSWDPMTKRNEYGMTEAVRRKILELTQDDPE